MFDKYWEDFHFSLWHLNARDVPSAFISFYERNYADKTGLKFLDIGCGTGGITEFLAKKGHNVVALDGSQLAIFKTKEIANSMVSLIVGDICTMNFAPESFDCLVDNCTLQTIVNVDEVTEIIQNMRGWLKPGGRFYSKTATSPYNYSRKNVPNRLMNPGQISMIYRGFIVDGWVESSTLGNGNKVTHFILDLKKV